MWKAAMSTQIHPKQQHLKNEHATYKQRKGCAFCAMVALTIFPPPKEKSYRAYRGIPVTGADALKKMMHVLGVLSKQECLK